MVYCFQNKWDKAEELLLSLATLKTETNVELYHGLHALALKNMIDGNFIPAVLCCGLALSGKKRILGPDHKSVEESIFLLAKIHEFSGDLIRAEVHRSMLKARSPGLICTVMTRPCRYIQTAFGLPPSISSDEEALLTSKVSLYFVETTRSACIRLHKGLSPLIIGINLV